MSINYQKISEDNRNILLIFDEIELQINQYFIGYIPADYENSLANLIIIQTRLKKILNNYDFIEDTDAEMIYKIDKNLNEIKKIIIFSNKKDLSFSEIKELNELFFITRLMFRKLDKVFYEKNNLHHSNIQSIMFHNTVFRYFVVVIISGLIFVFLFIRRIFNKRVLQLTNIVLNPSEYISGTRKYPYKDEFSYMIDNYLRIHSDKDKYINEIKYLQEYLNNVIESMPSMIFSLDRKFRIKRLNQIALDCLQVNTNRIKGRGIAEIIPYFKDFTKELNAVIKDKEIIHINSKKIFKGKETIYNITIFPVLSADIEDVVLRIDDVTELEKKESQLRQAQKMESIGTLAGGLAHDFNNILGGIIGTLSVMQFKLEEEDCFDKKTGIQQIYLMQELSERASDLVKQLLTLSRKNEISMSTLDLNSSIKRVQKICKNSFDKSIEINVKIDKHPCYIQGDISQIDQILLNLFINSAHAMTIMRDPSEKQGGSLSVDIEEIDADFAFVQTHPEAKEIPYWRVSVSDTGIGMSKEVINKIFDPFFTTKPTGIGTGLGLSMAYSIIKQHKGFIDIYSEVGLGSTFNIYFPIYKKKSNLENEDTDNHLVKGSGRILIVEDDNIINTIASSMLTDCGYQVDSVFNADEAIEFLKENPYKYDLAIVDLIMPKVSGFDLCKAIFDIKKDQKILLTSGFHQDERIKLALDLGVKGFISKPYTMQHFTQQIYDVINNKG
jgi:signal transduction histidine kinase/ActR/RegA family two-component response regulator